MISVAMMKDSDAEEAETQNEAEAILRRSLGRHSISQWVRQFIVLMLLSIIFTIAGLATMFAMVSFMFDVKYPLNSDKSSYGYVASNIGLVSQL